MGNFWVVEIEKGVWNSGKISEQTVLLEHSRRFKSKASAEMQLSRIADVLGYKDARVVTFCKTGNALIEVI